MYCGVTVFSVALSIERSTLFYMISLPMVDTINAMGLSTYLRFDSTTNGCVCLAKDGGRPFVSLRSKCKSK